MRGAHTWLEKGTFESGFIPESFKTGSLLDVPPLRRTAALTR